MKGTREELEQIAAMLGRAMRDELNDSTIGFVLVLFDFGPDGFMTYASNAQRAHAARLLRELATKMEGDA